MKKFTLVAAAFGLMMLAACGDDSSSNSSSNSKDAKGRTIYKDMVEAMEAPCSEANMCEVIIMDDPVAQDTLQCVGNRFQSLNGKENLPACEEKAPADAQPSDNQPSDAQPSDNPETPAAETPAAETPAAETPAAETPAAETPAAETPADETPAAETPAANTPKVYTDIADALEAPCSEANKCEIIFLDDPIAKDTLQCTGTMFQSMMGRANLPACEDNAAAADQPADAQPTDQPADNPETPAETPAAEGPTGDLVSCEVTVEGVFGEHSCVEGAADDAAVSQFCSSMATLGPDMHMTATAGTSCSAPATALKCVQNGKNFYSLDGKADCDAFLSDTMLSGLAK